MIEIQIHNGISLDLPADFTLSIIHENPMFLEDRIPAPYSVQFEVPSSARNLQAFGTPNRIAANGLKKRLPADIIHFGYIVLRGAILLIGAEEKPKLQFVGNVLTDNMQKNLNQIELGDYDYGDFPLEANNIDYSGSWATDYKAAMLTAATTGVPFAVAPMKIKGATWEGEDNIGGIKNTLRIFINYYNPYNHNFFITDGRLEDDYTPAHTPILPMPYLRDIINTAFGTMLESNPFAAGDFASLVLPTFNHKFYTYNNLLGSYYDHMLNPVMFFNPLVDDYLFNGTDWRDLSIHMKSFQQAYPFMSLLKDVLKIFSMTMFTGNKFSIERNDDIMSRNVIVNLDDKIAGTPIKSYEPAKDYVFSFGDTKSVITTNVDKSPHLKDIYDRMLGAEENVDRVLQDESSGGIYKLNKITVQKYVSDIIVITSEVQQSPNSVYYEESEREKYEVSSETKPIDLNIVPTWRQEAPGVSNNPINPLPTTFHWAVPEIDIKDIKSAPYLMFRTGMSQTMELNGTYPQLLANNYDPFGVKKFDFSLHPSGPDGLITKFHGSFKAWVEKDKLRLKTSVRLNPSELRTLDFRDKYHVGGRLFYIEKNEYQLTHRGLSLVESDLIEC